MALANRLALSPKSLYSDTNSLSKPYDQSQPTFALLPGNKNSTTFLATTTAVHAAGSTKNQVAVKESSTLAQSITRKWTMDSWKSKKILQLPQYPDEKEMQSVLKTIESFPPIVFAGEARSLEERLAEAAMGKAFLLQGGYCAESFKEFSANNIRDTFRVLLQMGIVLTFGGQMPVIKV